MMSFPSNWMLSAPLTDGEICDARIGIKEEVTEDTSEDNSVEIKEEPLDYADTSRHEEIAAKIKYEFPFFKEVQNFRHEANEKKLSYVIQDSNAMLPTAPFVAENCGDKCLFDGDEVTHSEVHEITHRKAVKKRRHIACEVCDNKFTSNSNLLIHMRVHTQEKPYSCEICNKSFSQKTNLERHMKVHTKEKPYTCEICNKAFSLKNILVRHMRIHTKEKPYSCEICSKAFIQKSILVGHMRVHTEEKPFICDICDKPFSMKNNLAKHKRVHTKEKPYSCEICSKAFSMRSNLVKHMKVHAKEKPI